MLVSFISVYTKIMEQVLLGAIYVKDKEVIENSHRGFIRVKIWLMTVYIQFHCMSYKVGVILVALSC